MKRVTVVLLALSMMLCIFSGQIFAADPSDVVIDVGMANTENENYKVFDNAINLSKDGVVYELTGTTDREIRMWGSNSPDPVKTFYIRLNNATLNGNVVITNTYGAKLVVEVMDGTVNTVKHLYSVNLNISGTGTLNSGDLGSTQSNDTNNLSTLTIKDTKVIVSQPTNAGDSSQWNGTCVLEGGADVTYISNTNYPPLRLGVTSKVSHSLLLKDNAKLRCLQADAANQSDYAVDGLSASFGATIKLQDSAYLEAQGRDSSGGYFGFGIISNADITVEDDATLKATAYGAAVYTETDFIMNGGNLDVSSEYSNALWIDKSFKANGAYIEAKAFGEYSAVYAAGGVTVENSTLKSNTPNGNALSSSGAIKLTNSLVKAVGGDGWYSIYSSAGVNVSGSWVEVTGPETFDESPDSIENSVLISGTSGKVIGSATIPADVTLDSSVTLTIPEGTSLIVPQGKTFTNNGIINLLGTIVRDGTIICNNHVGGTATCTEQATCDVCLAKYGDKDSENHTGEKVWSKNETKHSQKWNCCDAETVAEEDHTWVNGVCEKCDYACEHTGGTATCTEQATCEICGEKYGEKNSENHTGEKVWSKNETKHSQKWNCCDAETVAEEDHTWVNGVCEKCDYACEHTGGTATCTEQATCEICGEKYGEKNSENHTGEKVWSENETKHSQKWNCCDAETVAEEDHTWVNGVCEKCEYACEHTGGTATCTEKAVCEICGEAYNEIDSSNHVSLKHVEAKDATEEAEGNTEYWYCADCNKYFSDAHSTKEIEKSDTVVPKKDKTPDEPKNDENSGSGENGASSGNDPSNATSDTDKNGNADIPKTGDNANIALWVALMLLSSAAFTGVAVAAKSKKFNR